MSRAFEKLFLALRRSEPPLDGSVGSCPEEREGAGRSVGSPSSGHTRSATPIPSPPGGAPRHACTTMNMRRKNVIVLKGATERTLGATLLLAPGSPKQDIDRERSEAQPVGPRKAWLRALGFGLGHTANAAENEWPRPHGSYSSRVGWHRKNVPITSTRNEEE